MIMMIAIHLHKKKNTFLFNPLNANAKYHLLKKCHIVDFKLMCGCKYTYVQKLNQFVLF